MCSFFKCIFACILPPLAVLIDKGCSCDFCLNLFLTCLFWFPGCIHAYCVICAEKPEYPAPIVIVQGHQQQTTNVIDRQPYNLNGSGYNYQPMQQQMPHQMSLPYGHQMVAESHQMGTPQMAISAPQPPSYYESASAPHYQPDHDLMSHKNMAASID